MLKFNRTLISAGNIKFSHSMQFPQLSIHNPHVCFSVCLSVCPPTLLLHLTSDQPRAPLSVASKTASYGITHEERPLVYGSTGFRPEEEGGYGLMGSFAPELGGKRCLFVCTSVSLSGSFNIRSLAVSIGGRRIDLNSYQNEVELEITFNILKGFIAGIRSEINI